jgi:hypothetical protein
MEPPRILGRICDQRILIFNVHGEAGDAAMKKVKRVGNHPIVEAHGAYGLRCTYRRHAVVNGRQ